MTGYGFAMTRFPLTEKVVLITGAGNGLGAATATQLARRGARVVIADVDEVAARSTAARIPGAMSVPCDVTRAETLRAAVEKVIDAHGRLDVTIANAGVLGAGGTLRVQDPARARQVFDVNVQGALDTAAAAIEPIIASRGQIVVISSVFAYINGAGALPYAMSKAAVEQLGRGLHVELAPHGASAMTAYFALIDTGMIRVGLDADPHATALLETTPKVLRKRLTVDGAARALVRGIERRATSVTAPTRWRGVAAGRGFALPAFDRRWAADPRVHAALAAFEASALPGAPAVPTAPAAVAAGTD